MGCASSSLNKSSTQITEPKTLKENAKEIEVFVPNIGYVVKTKRPDSYAVNKVFINIFTHDKVPNLICNEVRLGCDKNNDSCLIYDCVINHSKYTAMCLLEVSEFEKSKLFVCLCFCVDFFCVTCSVHRLVNKSFNM